MECRICRSAGGGHTHTVPETMFGTGEKFIYFECDRCGCVQIRDIPCDMAAYYPSQYYSLKPQRQAVSGRGWKDKLKTLRYRLAYFDHGWAGRLARSLVCYEKHRCLIRLLPVPTDRILDVGCGSGAFLLSLREIGFRHLRGADPFLDADVDYGNGVRLQKRCVSELGGEWDTIMLHHSFEHMPNPLDTLRKVRSLLSERGVCMIRIPTASSYAWRHYRHHWVQLDAPRHLFLHTVDSIRLLAEQAGLAFFDTLYDSNAFQFWGSEQCRRGITLSSARSFGRNRRASVFSGAEIRAYRKKAKQLNAENQGDQACFYLKRG